MNMQPYLHIKEMRFLTNENQENEINVQLQENKSFAWNYYIWTLE